jgi:hypothetical protein
MKTFLQERSENKSPQAHEGVRTMKTKTEIHARVPFVCKFNLGVALVLVLLGATAAHGQLTPSGDSYINTVTPTTNYGAKTLLDVQSASQTTYIQFDLSAIPSGYTGANVTKASLKLYVNAVTTAGSLNVDYVNGTWSESTIDANNAPALGTTIAASVPLTTKEKNQYILVDITPAVQAWLNGTEPNYGIALVGNSPLNASFDSKENTTTSHAAELDIVFTGGGGGIAGITTASGSGLIGGGTSGTLNLSLTNACSANQVLEWNSTAWVCANLSGGGTITGVTAGADLTGGGTSGNVTLNLDTTKVPQLNGANTFTILQTIMASGNYDGLDSVAYTSGYNGVLGLAAATTGTGSGVFGLAKSASGYGVAGADASSSGLGTGVYGTSPSGNGVSGNSASGYGVLGKTTGGSTAGVSGVNSVSGYGVLGQATGSSGQGVWGESYGTGFSNGAGSDGVHGVANSTAGSGVAGINNAKDGIGVYGSDTTGYGFLTDSHASQARGAGGWVKAMVYVDPFKGGIQRCFNSQISGSQATTVPCGISYTYNGKGNYVIDFRFQVDDRFLQITSIYSFAQIGACLDDYCENPPYSIGPTQVEVLVNGGSNGDAPFFLTVL